MRYQIFLLAAVSFRQAQADLGVDIISDVITGLQAEEEQTTDVCRGVLGDAVGLPEFIVEAMCGWFDEDAVRSREFFLSAECPSSTGVVRVGEVLLTIQDVDLLVASGWGGGTPCVAWATLRRRMLE